MTQKSIETGQVPRDAVYWVQQHKDTETSETALRRRCHPYTPYVYPLTA